MVPYSQVLKQYEEFYSLSIGGKGPISKSEFKRFYDAVKNALPSLTIYVVAHVRHTMLDKYVRGYLGGVKFKYKHEKVGDPSVENVAKHIVRSFSEARGFHFSVNFPIELLGEAIVTEVSPLLDEALRHIKDYEKSAEKVEENKKVHEERLRQKAMYDLARVMESWKYTEEEVFQIWRTAQVKSVMES